MNLQTVIYTQDHLQDIRRETAQSRMLRNLPRTTLRQRLAVLAGNVRAAFATPAIAPGSVLPAVH
jgi:hypothetical protein